MKSAPRNDLSPLPYDEIVVLHDRAYDESTDDELFNITLAEEIGDIISTLGTSVTCLPYGDDTLNTLRKKKLAGTNFAVFNLVENVERKPEWQPRAMEALEALGIPFTGTNAGTLLACDADKFRMKEALLAQHLPTPAWATRNYTKPLYEQSGLWLVKSAIYHGSFNIHQDSVSDDPKHLLKLMQQYEDAHGGLWFAERYLEGREFYIAMIGRQGEDPELLPEAEIIYDRTFFKDGLRPLLTEAAKWDENGAEFKATRTAFGELPDSDPLKAELTRLATACWKALGLNGYARVDFRIDEHEKPHILEVNTNPYLGIHDSFIFQPAAKAGLSVADVLAKIILCAHQPQ